MSHQASIHHNVVVPVMGVGIATELNPEPPVDELSSHPILLTDNPMMIEMTQFMLEDQGFEVIATPYAYEALRICQSQSISLVISNLKKPDMDGLEFVRQLRANPRTQHIPVLIISAAEKVNDALAVGADGYLMKPLTIEAFIAEVRRLYPGGEHA